MERKSWIQTLTYMWHCSFPLCADETETVAGPTLWEALFRHVHRCTHTWGKAIHFLNWILTNWRERMLNDSLVCFLYQASINLPKPGFSFPILLPHLLSHITRSQSWDRFCCWQSLSNKDWISRLTTGEWTCLVILELSCFFLAYSTTIKVISCL